MIECYYRLKQVYMLSFILNQSELSIPVRPVVLPVLNTV